MSIVTSLSDEDLLQDATSYNGSFLAILRQTPYSEPAYPLAIAYSNLLRGLTLESEIVLHQQPLWAFPLLLLMSPSTVNSALRSSSQAIPASVTAFRC